jgi:hypothetical protein
MAGGTRERYEAGSAEWLQAFRDFLTSEVTDADMEGLTPCTASYELTDPPQHLLHDGSDSVGWFIRFQDGRFVVGDHPLAESDCDFLTVGDYAALAPTFRWSRAEWDENVQRVIGLGREGKVRNYSDPDPGKWRPLSSFMLDVVRDRFYIRHTA